MRFFPLVILGLTASTLVLPMLTIAQGHPEMPAQAKARQEFHNYLDADWKRWMELYPEFATSVGYPGQNRRWTDDSPRGIATRKGQLDESIKKLRAIDRNALPASEQVNHELIANCWKPLKKVCNMATIPCCSARGSLQSVDNDGDGEPNRAPIPCQHAPSIFERLYVF
jgi:hypothetical protein